MKAMIIKADGSLPKVKDIKKDLNSYYREIGCDVIDIVSRRIGGQDFDIICDDEGLLKSDPVVTAITPDGQAALVGTLIIVRFDGEEDITDLKPGDATLIAKAIRGTVQQERMQPVVIVE